ncbi:MAG: tetratricopeptide repeat protein [Chitinophagaceae bacterium]
MPDNPLHRAVLLLQQHKFKEAEIILNGLFAEDPTNTDVIGLMCELKIFQDKFDEAMTLISNAIGLDPGASHLFHKRARIFIQQDKYDAAEKDLQQAISIDPYETDYFALLSLLKIERKQFSDALEIADKALELNAENIQALNARSTALLKLNRKEESFSTIHDALREDPDNAYTHANYGWGLLEKGSHKNALLHFAEALKKNPNLTLAQQGMAEALKARYFVYRSFLKFSLWMSNLRGKNQWAVIIGFYLLFRLIRWGAESNPSLQPFLNPLLVLLGLFAFSTWIITPVSNLFLRLNKYGKHLLNREQIIASNFVGFSILIALVGGILYLFKPQPYFLVIVAFGLTMMIPLSAMLTFSKKRTLLVSFTCLLAIVGTTGFIMGITSGEAFNNFVIAYIIGLILFQWVANYLVIRQTNK